MRGLHSTVIDFNRMPAKEGFALLKALYPFHNTVFEGIDEQGFARAMLNPHAQLNKLKVFRDDSAVLRLLRCAPGGFANRR